MPDQDNHRLSEVCIGPLLPYRSVSAVLSHECSPPVPAHGRSCRALTVEEGSCFFGVNVERLRLQTTNQHPEVPHQSQ